MLDKFFAYHLSRCHYCNFDRKHDTFFAIQRQVLESFATTDGYEERVDILEACPECPDISKPNQDCALCQGFGGVQVGCVGIYYQRWYWKGHLFKLETFNPIGPCNPPSQEAFPQRRITNTSFFLIASRYKPIYLWQCSIYSLKTKIRTVIQRLKRRRDDALYRITGRPHDEIPF